MLVTTQGGLWVELEPGDIIALSHTKVVDEPVIFLGFDAAGNRIRYRRPFGQEEAVEAKAVWLKLLEKGTGVITDGDNDH